MRITVFGATGGTGRELVRQALERGHEVVAFVRSPEKLGVAHERLAAVEGGVRSLDEVSRAVKGSDAVLSALGSRPGATPICADGVRNIARAMREDEVRRLVVESAYGAGSSRRGIYGRGLWLVIPRLMRDKEEMEDVLRSSDLEWIVVRPTALTSGTKRGAYRHGPDLAPRGIAPHISRADVADFMLDQLTADTYLHSAVTVTY